MSRQDRATGPITIEQAIRLHVALHYLLDDEPATYESMAYMLLQDGKYSREEIFNAYMDLRFKGELEVRPDRTLRLTGK